MERRLFFYHPFGISFLKEFGSTDGPSVRRSAKKDITGMGFHEVGENDMAVKKMTPEDLRTVKQKVAKEKELRRDGYMGRITVHMNTCGLASGAQSVMDRLLQEVSKCGRSDIAVNRSSCIGLCSREPLVTVELLGQEPVIYQRVDEQKARRIFEEHILAGKVQADLALARGRALNEEPIPSQSDLEGVIPHVSQLKFFALQQRLVLRNKGLIDPDRIDDYIWRDGYLAAAKALLEMTPSEIISEVKTSGLRGRGDGGFPLGIMLEFCANSREDVRYVLCTADEADPGAFVSRSVMESDPHAVLEGMVIAAKAIGAHQGYLYCRADYSLATEKIHMAIDQARVHGLLGKNILGSGFDFDIEMHQGDAAAACGEKTAWMGATEGDRDTPRPSSLVALGLWKKPTLVNNIETYINLPRIMLLGGEAYAELGTESSIGTKLLSLAGKVNNAGLVEVPMGTTVGEIVFDMGGGIPDGKKFKAVQAGGLSGGCLPPEHLNTPIDYDALTKVGAIMGSGSMIVMDDGTCMVDMARYFMDFCQNEVCGQCNCSCRAETKRMLEILQRICRGEGHEGDIELLEDLSRRVKDTALCRLGQTMSNPVLSTIRFFRHEYEAHILDKRCPAAVCLGLFKSPCQHICPVGMDAPAYIALIRAGRIDDAYKVLKQTNPFPSVCGRVCGHECQTICRRGQLDEPVAIMHLKRFIADHARRPKTKPLPIIRKEKVAIIGAGPSGLTAALELKKRGYGVTVYEALPKAGGMLRWGIPAYRLPRNELDRETDDILQTGVQLLTNKRVGRDVTFDELDSKFDVIYLATGAQKSSSLNIPGEDAEGVFGVVEFLQAQNLGRGIKVGKKVAVIGGGISALDAARTAVRLGAKKVTLYYRRERSDMPLQAQQIEAAEEEGVRIMDQAAPVRVVIQYGKVRGLELTQTRPGRFDPSSRRQPIPILGSEFIEKADTVIIAVGRVPDLDFLPKESGVERNQTAVKVDRNLRTTHAKVWAGGDIATGPAMVIDAIEAGQAAARSIDNTIRLAHGEKPWIALVEEMLDIPSKTDEEPVEQPQVPTPMAPSKVRRTDFREAELGYTSEMALAEARRCLRCDAVGGFDTSIRSVEKGGAMVTKGEILLVDDDPDFRDSLQIILENHGYTVRTASNGTEALEALKVKKPDLMILDVMMATETEGFDLAYDLKKRPGFKYLPIILLTSFLERVRREGPEKFQHITGEEWPARWMFEKPVDTKKLVAKIEGILAGG
ncbi:MAG TPA: FAD-dependent oxidoreductase [Thermodesulfobacteriota bacterium]|nr:FAD-dependent oxidoreductase [Thermodesulfobacteriota bacterium]